MKTGDTVVDRYRLENKLGMGGMGTVWSAEHIQTGRRFALKIMHATVAANEDSRQRFLKEAKASARIDHPSVIDVLDVGELPDGALFMAMELLEGMALVDALRLEPPLSVRELLFLLRDVSSALAAAHAVGIVHRDVKPANIFLHRDKATGLVRPKVLDFGVSKFAFLEESSTQTGSLLGSPRYMSPEQARSASQADGRSDVWSLGVILFEALTGTYPHEGDSFSNLVVAIATVPPKSIAHQGAAVPPPLAALVGECLQVRDQRLASCEQLARRIDALLSSGDFSDLPCARGKSKKAFERPADFQIRPASDTPWDPGVSPSAPLPRFIDEPSTNPAPAPFTAPAGRAAASPPAPPLALTPPPPQGLARSQGLARPQAVPAGATRSLFDHPSSAATQLLRTPGPPQGLRSPAGTEIVPPPTDRRAPTVRSSPASPPPRPPTPDAYAQETTTIHDRSLLRSEPGPRPDVDASTRLIEIPRELAADPLPPLADPPELPPEPPTNELPRITARMHPGPMGPPPAPHGGSYPPGYDGPRDHLVESVANFNVERYRAGASSLSGPPPNDSVNQDSPLRRSNLGAALAVASFVVVSLSVGAFLFLGRNPAEAPAAASPAAPVDVGVGRGVAPATTREESPATSPPSVAPAAEPSEPAEVVPTAEPAGSASASPTASASAAPTAPPPPAPGLSAPAAPPGAASAWAPPAGTLHPGSWRPGKKCDKSDPIGCLDPGF